MSKLKISICILFICVFSFNLVVKASDDGFITVSSESELERCLTTELGCRLSKDIELTSAKGITGNVFLDLNGHIIEADPNLKLNSGLLFINRGSKLTIEDKTGVGKITTGKNDKVYAAIQLIKIDDNSSQEPAELIVNGGTLEGYYYGITGNGKLNHTKLTINGGTIRALNDNDSVGIYQPQIGETIINNGNISGGTAIEIRSGDLTVNNGTIKATSPTFNRVANSSGTTTNGAGITIAQHTTKNSIKAVINNGHISGQYALYEWNPQKNSKTDLNKISIQVKGGEFNSVVNDGYAVYSENFTDFISGGRFNTEVKEYLTKDAQVTSTNLTNMQKLEKKSTPKYILILIIFGILSLGIFLYPKFKKIYKQFKNAI